MSKKKKNYFIKLFILLFIFFIIVYFSDEAGYYEYKMYTKTRLTNEAIAKFENDVSLGKDVSINDYIISDYVDYSNDFTHIGSEFGNFIEKIMNNAIEKALDVLIKLFYK